MGDHDVSDALRLVGGGQLCRDLLQAAQSRCQGFSCGAGVLFGGVKGAAFQRLGGLGGKSHDEPALVLIEQARVGEAEPQGAQDRAGHRGRDRAQ
jgi:hypothetical protein